ncbi:MAG: helix-turn-helix domain-containing protein [Bacteroidetes bacterium]|nr:helix-turn-helix domain-containing protein [Bacteroidota bacterium]
MNDKSYVDWVSMSDNALSETIGAFIKHHRLNQNKTQDEISTAAGISRSTLSLLERGETVTLSSFIQVLRVLDLLYIMNAFEVKEQISPIEYAKMKQNKRQRARNQSEENNSNNDSQW